MTRTSTALAALAAAALAVGCATPLGDSQTLSQAAIDAAARLAPAQPPGLATTAEARVVMTVPYNLGIKGYSEELHQSRTLANGLKETLAQGSLRMAANQSSGAARTISLCGLVPLIIESGSTGSMGTLVFTGKPGTFFPVGASPATAVRQIATSFESTSTELCRPTAGLAFSFKTAMKLETHIPPFRRVVDLEETWRCQVSDDLGAQAALREAGGTLLAVCAITGAGLDRPSQRQFVYFPKLMEYFPVHAKYVEGHFHETTYARPPSLAGR